MAIVWASIWINDMIEGRLLLAQYMTNVSMIEVVALIIWYAWKWPKPEA